MQRQMSQLVSFSCFAHKPTRCMAPPTVLDCVHVRAFPDMERHYQCESWPAPIDMILGSVSCYWCLTRPVPVTPTQVPSPCPYGTGTMWRVTTSSITRSASWTTAVTTSPPGLSSRHCSSSFSTTQVQTPLSQSNVMVIFRDWRCRIVKIYHICIEADVQMYSNTFKALSDELLEETCWFQDVFCLILMSTHLRTSPLYLQGHLG